MFSDTGPLSCLSILSLLNCGAITNFEFLAGDLLTLLDLGLDLDLDLKLLCS